MEGIQRIALTEDVSVGDAVAFAQELVGLTEPGRPGGEIVGVCSDEVDDLLFEEIEGHALGLFAHVPQDGVCGDLDENS